MKSGRFTKSDREDRDRICIGSAGHDAILKRKLARATGTLCHVICNYGCHVIVGGDGRVLVGSDGRHSNRSSLYVWRASGSIC